MSHPHNYSVECLNNSPQLAPSHATCSHVLTAHTCSGGHSINQTLLPNSPQISSLMQHNNSLQDPVPFLKGYSLNGDNTKLLFNSDLVLSICDSNMKDFIMYILHPGPCLNIKTVFPGMDIPMLKIRRSQDRLIFNMGMPTLVRVSKTHLYTDSVPRSQFDPSCTCYPCNGQSVTWWHNKFITPCTVSTWAWSTSCLLLILSMDQCDTDTSICEIIFINIGQ